jgi:hypothetical protein
VESAQLAPFTISVSSVGNTNQAPVISGTPATTVNEGEMYNTFTPVASDADGDVLTFAANNLPGWTSFDSTTGALSGTPSLSDAGDYGNIIISVSDGVESAQLAPFAISVSVSDTNQALAISTHTPAAQETGTPLRNNITVTFDTAIDASTVSSSSVVVQGTGGVNIPAVVSASNQTVTIDPVSNFDPATTYSVTITSAVSGVNGEAMDADYSWNFTTMAGTVIPDIDKWEQKMVTAGEKWGQYLLSYFPAEGSYSESVGVYYDAQRVYLQISDYTGQAEPWNTYAEEAERVYMNYAVPHNFAFGGWRRFAQGIYMDYVRTGDMTAYENIVKIRDLPAFSNVSDSPWIYAWYWESRSREIAYAIEANIFAERVGHPRDDADMALYVTMALNHIKEWTTGEFGDPTSHRTAPFMFGLTAEALIMFYEWELENGRDPTALYDHAAVPVEVIPTMTIPEALKLMADYLREEAVVESGDNIGKPMWVPDLGRSGGWNDLGGTGYAAFRYEDIKAGSPTPVLNLLIAPVYAWLFQHYGEIKYLTTADQLFVSGVNLADVSWNTKQFNQNYRWSFDYIKWRNEGSKKWL